MTDQRLATTYGDAAQHNRAAFDATLEGYVGQKLAYSLKRLERGESEVWFDTTDCVWCVFDDPAFERHEGVRERLRAMDDGATRASREKAAGDLQVYWSLGDVVMPAECDTLWVARRIADEARRQLEARGYRCESVERMVEDEMRVGVVARHPSLPKRLIQKLFRRDGT